MVGLAVLRPCFNVLRDIAEHDIKRTPLQMAQMVRLRPRRILMVVVRHPCIVEHGYSIMHWCPSIFRVLFSVISEET